MLFAEEWEPESTYSDVALFPGTTSKNSMKVGTGLTVLYAIFLLPEREIVPNVTKDSFIRR